MIDPMVIGECIRGVLTVGASSEILTIGESPDCSGAICYHQINAVCAQNKAVVCSQRLVAFLAL